MALELGDRDAADFPIQLVETRALIPMGVREQHPLEMFDADLVERRNPLPAADVNRDGGFAANQHVAVAGVLNAEQVFHNGLKEPGHSGHSTAGPIETR